MITPCSSRVGSSTRACFHPKATCTPAAQPPSIANRLTQARRVTARRAGAPVAVNATTRPGRYGQAGLSEIVSGGCAPIRPRAATRRDSMAQLIDPFRRSLRGHLHRSGAGVPVPAAVIASTSTPVPRGIGNFTFMTFPQVSPEIAVFVGSGKDQPSNVYASLGGSLQVFLAVGAGVPSTGGKFTDFGLPTPAGQAAAFVGAGSEDTLGVYVKSGEIMQRVADTRMVVPGGAGTFSAFGQPGFDAGGTIAFVGRDGSGVYGVYAAGFPVKQAPVVVANSSTPIPGGGGTFSYFDGAVATAAGITFFGNHEGQTVAAGIYTFR